ncbi:hypothetical protein PR048_005642 [Dryococelus australis]|uniref:HAT C-terminal dimerisation domain-containing protein n=1 Tax=Dryococelus australis TaxID=614101 RepID=A0ABQ9I9Q2_9NEOP|nr:hypothetical protein PR048_005642 [Dryococelus australis]
MSIPPLENEGDFRVPLGERVKSGDEMLRRHFELGGRNATYISWNIQNQIVEACNDIMTNKIADEVNSMKCFSVLADETTDISCSVQFTLCLRYVKHESNRGYSLQESFLQFLPLEETTAKMTTIFYSSFVVSRKVTKLHIATEQNLQATDADLASALDCEETARNIGSQITIPRLVKGRQVHRANVPAENAKEYARHGVFISWTDGLISNLRARLIKHTDILTSFVPLLPSGTSPSKESTVNFIKLTEFYKTDLDSVGMKSLISKFKLWYNKFKCVQHSKPSTPTVKDISALRNTIDALNVCDNSFFPNVHVLLKIFSSLHVSTSTPERTFSTLRRIKNYLRNTMDDTRLNGLANLYSHREIPIYQEEVIDNLFLKGFRRLNCFVKEKHSS